MFAAGVSVDLSSVLGEHFRRAVFKKHQLKMQWREPSTNLKNTKLERRAAHQPGDCSRRNSPTLASGDHDKHPPKFELEQTSHLGRVEERGETRSLSRFFRGCRAHIATQIHGTRAKQRGAWRLAQRQGSSWGESRQHRSTLADCGIWNPTGGYPRLRAGAVWAPAVGVPPHHSKQPTLTPTLVLEEGMAEYRKVRGDTGVIR